MTGNAGVFIQWEARRRAAAGDHEGALALASKIEPADAQARILLGRVQAQRGAFPQAAAAFREALALEPENTDARRGLELAERLGSSRLGRVRLHFRRWVVLAALLALGLAGWRLGSADRVSNRELAARLAELDRKIVAARAGMQDDNRGLANRLGDLERALETQAAGSGRATQQIRAQLRRLQQQVAGNGPAGQR
jgi:tetratricopeptide (TPR) repeat protein